MARLAPFSLRRRLLLLSLSTVILAWAVVAALSYRDARHEIDEVFDAQLVESAQLLVAQVGHEPEELEIPQAREWHPYQRRIVFQAWDSSGRLVLRSAGAPMEALAPQAEGFGDSVLGGQRWRTFSLQEPEHGIRILVGERYDVRRELATRIALRVLYPLLLALPLLGLALWVSIGRGLVPLKRLAGEVKERDPQNLAPFDPGAAPAETAPLVEALNRLFDRLKRAFDSERRFTADAAHELRTPLAALKTQAQVALTATGLEERRHALEQVVRGVDRATRLVEQLLTLARLDPDSAEMKREPVDLRSLAASCLAESVLYALEKEVDLSLAEGPKVLALGDATMLAALVRNLVGNAIRYTPSGGEVRVSLLLDGGRPVLEVTDTGPGIPSDEREAVFRRFYRGLGSGEGGSGLGLSIVKRIADLHGANLALSAGKGERGLRVRVAFPPCPPAGGPISY